MSNSIEKLAKEAKRLAENLQGNPFSAFDRIAKDIRERQDNAMAMEFTKCIGELLRKNGVAPKMTEYTRNFETDNTFKTRYGVSIDELDFSEHDKVFEDKIAKLEENVGYYKDCLSRVEKNCDKLYHENQELKQRIAELESFSVQVEQDSTSLIFDLQQKIKSLQEECKALHNQLGYLRICCCMDSARECFDNKDYSGLLIYSKSFVDKKEQKLCKENAELKQRIEELESKETETCKNEPKISDSAPGMEWYENRHQSDCIEINRLNTTIDVLIHKVEYLRQFAGLE